jgi:site-specific recombinase XerD
VLAYVPNYPHLIQQRRVWFVRIVVPADVRGMLNKSIYKVTTKETDIHRALLVAAPIIAAIKQTIADARAGAAPPVEMRAEALAARYRELSGPDAERFKLDEVVKFVLRETGRELHAYAADLVPQNHVAFPNEDTHAARQVRIITGKATPFLEHLEPWKAAVTVSPKTRDEYESAIREFAARVTHPIEDLTQAHVQYWVDGLLSVDEDDSLDAKTVNKKLSGLRNYWGYMSLRGPVERGRKIFNDLDVRNRTGHVSIKMARYLPKDVVRLWRAAETSGNEPLANMIKIAAYTGGRREGIACLKVSDIKVDPDTGVRFMHTTGKTDAGDRDVPIHAALAPLIDRLVERPDADGYLIPSEADNQYGIRGTLLGKDFSLLKSRLGFGEEHNFHSIRRTVTHMLETAECPEGVAKDIIGHKKLDITFGLYSGLTPIDQRAKWLEKAIIYAT